MLGYYDNMVWQSEPGDDSDREFGIDDYPVDTSTCSSEPEVGTICFYIPCEDEPVHTSEHPFCNDPTCVCLVEKAFDDGYVSEEDMREMYADKVAHRIRRTREFPLRARIVE